MSKHGWFSWSASCPHSLVGRNDSIKGKRQRLKTLQDEFLRRGAARIYSSQVWDRSKEGVVQVQPRAMNFGVIYSIVARAGSGYMWKMISRFPLVSPTKMCFSLASRGGRTDAFRSCRRRDCVPWLLRKRIDAPVHDHVSVQSAHFSSLTIVSPARLCFSLDIHLLSHGHDERLFAARDFFLHVALKHPSVSREAPSP